MNKNNPMQHISYFDILYFLDLIGVFSCAVAATVLAKRLKLDMFGAIIVSFVGAIGGGTVRDVLLDRHPLFWMHDLNYMYLIISTSLLVQVFYHFFERFDETLRRFDALGLAAFTVIGVEAALAFHKPIPVVIMMGVVTAVVGGILRDTLCRQLPLVMYRDMYITPSLSGCILYLYLLHQNCSLFWRGLITITFIFSFRMLSVHRGWNLPDITLHKKSYKEK